jgi:type II secretory pathway component PulM
LTFAVRIEERLRSLSARERFLLLVGAVAAVLFLVARLAVYPAVEGYRKACALIPERRAMLQRYQEIRAGQTDVTEKLTRMSEELAKAETGLLPGSDPDAAGAELQGMLKPMMNRTDTRVTSVRTVSPVRKGKYDEVAVQLDMQTSTEGLSSFLATIPRQQKILRVKKLTVSSGLYNAAQANRLETLKVSLTVAGWTRTQEETAAQEGGGR